MILLLLACNATDTDSDAPAVPLDPDVMSWSPASFPPADLARIVFFGDSITAGYGIRDDDIIYPNMLAENADNRWPAAVGDDLLARYGEVESINLSRNGARTNDLMTQIAGLDGYPAPSGHTAVFVTIGGNDIVGALAQPGSMASVPQMIEANIEEAVLELQARHPQGVSILFTNVYEPTDGQGQADECFFGVNIGAAAEPALDDTNARTLALAMEHGFAWVDLRAHFEGHGYNFDHQTIDTYHGDDPTLWLQDDCIHPTARGHHEIRRLFLAALDNEPLTLWVP